MNNNNLQRILPTMLITTLLLTGCTNKKDNNCNLTNPHAHLYHKEITSNLSLNTYLPREDLEFNGYKKTDDVIPLSDYDIAFYNATNNLLLFEGIYHWDYLYSLMYRHQDYIKFENISIENKEVTVFDKEGNSTIRTIPTKIRDFKDNCYAEGNTGLVRIYHHMFYGYKIEEIKGKLTLVKSPLVDDIREILEEYPYYTEGCFEVVTHDVELTPGVLRFIEADGFTFFNHPDLTNKTMYLDKTLTK